MSRPYVLYSNVAMFVGPAPSNTGHFINTIGTITNNDNPTSNFNLVFPLNRVQGTNFSFSESRTDVKSLGVYGTISRPSLIQPNISLSFSYYMMGLINEARLGFIFNTPSGITGQPLYGQSLNICPISGFLDRTYQRSFDTPLGWPLTTREPKNLFVATNQGFNDLNDYVTGIYKSIGVDVFAFGDCFLNSYKQSASINQLPLTTVEFICNNVETYNFASGTNIPSINTQNGLVNSGNIYDLPNNFETTNTGLPTAIIPSNIIATINSIPSGDYLAVIEGNALVTVLDAYGDEITITEDMDIVNLPISINDLKIQSYNFDLTLNREPLYNLGYKFPIDRRINFPVYCNLDINAIVGENATGSLTRFLSKDREWDIILNLSFQTNTQLYTGTAIIYKFLKSKFNSISFGDSIGKVKTANLSFTTEIKPNSNTKGFFISGILGIGPDSVIQTILGTGVNPNQNPIELIDFSELLVSNVALVQPLY